MTDSSSMYCCTGFENLITCAGDRGNSAVAWHNENHELRFFLQSRGMAFGDETKVTPVDIDVKINISAETGMRYCPFCGRCLEELTRQHHSDFVGLAKQHEKYLASMPKL